MQSIAHEAPRRFRMRRRSADLLWIKRGIWLYFWLLIVEGALRKWILPQLSVPLLLVRDPVLIWVYWLAFRSGTVKSPKLDAFWIFSMPIIILACIQIDLQTNTLLVALYGLRSYLFHLPLVLIIAETFTFEDVKKVGRWLLILSVPIALLMVVQYRAPASSWWNAGAGGDSGQMIFAGDHVRAAGPFSFATGPVSFFPLVEAFLLFALGRPGTYPKWILVPSSLAVIVALPIAGSRTLLFVTVAMVAFTLFSGVRNRRTFLRLAEVIIVLVITCAAALLIPVFHEAVSTFQDRWREASAVEGNVGDVLSLRVLGVVTDGFASAQTVSWLGQGIGMGSNVAAYLTTGSQKFLLAEMEWPRVVLEFGPFLGLGFLMFRVYICWDLLISARRALRRGSGLSWLLVPATVPFLVINSMEQSTNLGFMILSAGLCFAAAKDFRSARELRRFARGPLRRGPISANQPFVNPAPTPAATWRTKFELE